MTKTILILHCVNCKDHQWQTWHDGNAYLKRANLLKEEILRRDPNCQVMLNLLPEEQRMMYRAYSELLMVGTVDRYIIIKPPLWAFEVFVDGQMVYSKI